MSSEKRTLLGIAIGWLLLVAYSVLLTFALQSIIDLSIRPFWEVNQSIEIIVIFVYGLAAVSFLGGTQIPAIFLKKKSFLVQFGFSAAFGLMLLVIPLVFNESNFPVLGEAKSFFFSFPIVTIEYLSIPYLFMILIDFYIGGRLSAFSLKYFRKFCKGVFLHPKSTFEGITFRRSTLYSLITIILVSIMWVTLNIFIQSTGFGLVGWHFVPLHIYTHLDLTNGIALTLPSVLLAWLIISVVVYVAERRLSGINSYKETASLLGFSFLPSLLTVGVGLSEIILLTRNIIIPGVITFVAGFLIPIILWPLALTILSIRESTGVPLRKATLVALSTFFPLFILVTQLFL